MLRKILNEKKCFKLVCGAGNEDVDEVEKLVALYSLAGCKFFDLSANKRIVLAAQKGLSRVGKENDAKFCISFGIKGDPHICKAEIKEENCNKCNACVMVCPQNAIKDHKIITERCIGCLKCAQECAFDAINITSKDAVPSEVIKEIICGEIACIELHASGSNEVDTLEKWNDINNCFDGLLSICIDRSYLGNKALLERIKTMIGQRMPYTTIIQADGIPMSGSNDDFKTTLQAVAIAEIIQDAKLPVYLMLSGGTNSKTTQLAKQCGISAHGIAIGSYARKIVKDYINRDDFFKNKSIFNEALVVARNLVEESLKYL